MTPKDVIKLAKDRDAKLVDVKFCDFLGTWQHYSMPLAELSEDVLAKIIASAVNPLSRTEEISRFERIIEKILFKI